MIENHHGAQSKSLDTMLYSCRASHLLLSPLFHHPTPRGERDAAEIDSSCGILRGNVGETDPVSPKHIKVVSPSWLPPQRTSHGIRFPPIPHRIALSLRPFPPFPSTTSFFDLIRLGRDPGILYRLMNRGGLGSKLGQRGARERPWISSTRSPGSASQMVEKKKEKKEVKETRRYKKKKKKRIKLQPFHDARCTMYQNRMGHIRRMPSKYARSTNFLPSKL